MKKIQLSIPEPCHENWDAMTATQQGRYCNACAKEVIDFSNMSDSAVLNYFLKKKDDTICGRAYPDQLDRNINALPQKKKLYWYLNYVFAFVLFFGKANKARSQSTGGMMVYVAADTVKPIKNTDKRLQRNNTVITGFITDSNGQAIPYASIKLLHTSKGTTADINGRFTLTVKKINKIIEITALNYETKQIAITDAIDKEIMLAKKITTMDEVIINSTDDRRVMGGMSRCYVVRGRSLKDTITNWFTSPIKIYPNPVPKGNAFTISMKLKQPGSYTIQVVDAAGRLLSENKITASSKLYNAPFTSGSNWSAGVYYIKVMDDKSQQVGTTSVVVQ